jgi:HSP20 family protein
MDIDLAGAKAVCENGVLVLTLPKSAGNQNKTLQIE